MPGCKAECLECCSLPALDSAMLLSHTMSHFGLFFSLLTSIMLNSLSKNSCKDSSCLEGCACYVALGWHNAGNQSKVLIIPDIFPCSLLVNSLMLS